MVLVGGTRLVYISTRKKKKKRGGERGAVKCQEGRKGGREAACV